jgi:hypothetical protein
MTPISSSVRIAKLLNSLLVKISFISFTKELCIIKEGRGLDNPHHLHQNYNPSGDRYDSDYRFFD